MGLKDAKKIIQLMRLLVSGRIGFVLPPTDASRADTGSRPKNTKAFAQLCIRYLCSAITTLTHQDPDTYVEIMRLCNEVN